MEEEHDHARRLDNLLIDGSPSIWVTHGPPYGVCDKVGAGQHGSRALLLIG